MIACDIEEAWSSASPSPRPASSARRATNEGEDSAKLNHTLLHLLESLEEERKENRQLLTVFVVLSATTFSILLLQLCCIKTELRKVRRCLG